MEESTGGGGYGDPIEPGGPVNDGSPVEVKPREISSEEAQRAGLLLTTTTYYMWTDAGNEFLTEQKKVYFPADTADIHEIKSVVEYPGRGIAQLTVERTA